MPDSERQNGSAVSNQDTVPNETARNVRVDADTTKSGTVPDKEQPAAAPAVNRTAVPEGGEVSGEAGTGAPENGQPSRGAGTLPAPFAAELEALRKDLEERTSDLQRVTAEYANYRRRMDRERARTSEQATAAVLTDMLGVLDDLDRAREHGDLVGPFGAVADQVVSVLTKVGLSPFGDRGDSFDPMRHEAVTHTTSSEVDEPTCVEVFRRGYAYGERLLRPALVAVAEPGEDPIDASPDTAGHAISDADAREDARPAAEQGPDVDQSDQSEAEDGNRTPDAAGEGADEPSAEPASEPDVPRPARRPGPGGSRRTSRDGTAPSNSEGTGTAADSGRPARDV